MFHGTHAIILCLCMYICGEGSALKLHGADTFLYSAAVKCIKKNEVHMSLKVVHYYNIISNFNIVC